MKLLTPIFCSALILVSPLIKAAEATKVDVMFASASQQQQVLTLIGTVEARQNADLATLQSGVVQTLNVEVGDVVEKGQSLLSLDAKLAELSLAQSKASVNAIEVAQQESQRLYQEVVELSKKQLVAETLMAERLSALEVAKAELIRAKAQFAQQEEVLARHTLFAPFSGVVAQRHIDIGEWVTPQTPVFTLVEQARLRVNLAIPQEYFNQLANNKEIDVTIVPDFTKALPIAAKLDRLVAVANNNSRTIVGLVELPEHQNLVAGMSVRAEISLPASQQSVVWLPKSAIKQHPDGGRSVFTVENNKAKHVLVKVIKQLGNKVAVSGVSAEQAFIVSGVALLKDGEPLSVTQVQGDTL